MKVIAISGSPRDKNTSKMIKIVLDSSGLDYEFIQLKDLNINYCKACGKCFNGSNQCGQKDDMATLQSKMLDADLIVLGSPTHFSNVSDHMKTFMDRYLPFYFSQKLKGKKAIILSIGNFHQTLEFDKEGKCKWHKEERESVLGTIKALKAFCQHLGLDVIGSASALHGDVEHEQKKLVRLGKQIETFK